jgi:hypothetical protein
MERAADELRGEIDRGATQELERYRVYDGVSPSHGGVFKYTLRTFLGL